MSSGVLLGFLLTESIWKLEGKEVHIMLSTAITPLGH